MQHNGVGGQAEALNAKSLAMDTLRQQLSVQVDEQKSRVVELSHNLKLVMREKEMAEAAARQARDDSARTIAPSEREQWQEEVSRLISQVETLQHEMHRRGKDDAQPALEAQVQSYQKQLLDAHNVIQLSQKHQHELEARVRVNEAPDTSEVQRLTMELRASQHENSMLRRKVDQDEAEQLRLYILKSQLCSDFVYI
jgi:hypothetical protein